MSFFFGKFAFMQLETALYMIPVPISDGPLNEVLPSFNSEIIGGIKHFIVENVRTARRFLKKIDPSTDISQITFYELNGHTPENEIWGYLSPLRNGMPMGVMSEAGCPGVADPGAKVVLIAQNEGRKVVPMVGPSSILLSLMASGLNGQKFAFQGYLPVDSKQREKTIRDLEAQSRRWEMTQIFIETPYRNEKLMESLLKNLNGETMLCVASDVTGQNESITTNSVKHWKEKGYKLDKVPTIFLFYCNSSVK